MGLRPWPPQGYDSQLPKSAFSFLFQKQVGLRQPVFVGRGVIGISRDGELYVVFVFGEAKNKHHIYTLSRQFLETLVGLWFGKAVFR